MRYVQRDSAGNITGTYANLQPGMAEEALPDDHPELLAFISRFPPGFLTAPTEREWATIRADHQRLDREHEQIRNSVLLFNSIFSQLETALSALLYVTLNIPSSKVAYAIYFSPPGFEARCEIVDNALKQIIFENAELRDLLPLWARVFLRVNKARKIRNTIAHGSPITLNINGASHARLTAPAFDVIRLGRTIANRQVPGLTASDIREGIQTVNFAHDRVDDVNRLVSAFYGGRPILQQRYRELEAGLLTSRSQNQVAQVQATSGFHSPPSRE